MMHKRQGTVALNSTWQVPASTWAEIISRYVRFIQVPTWRASVKSDGSEKRACLSNGEATALGKRMSGTLARLLPHSRSGLERKAKADDLRLIFERQGRHVPRDLRCSKALGSHLLRAFLLNAAGYSCLYCGRSACRVYDEDTGSEPRRTLRFEIDHRTTRRRLSDPLRFDLGNLVVACRSCNTIKAEMSENRFRRELASLASAVCGDRE